MAFRTCKLLNYFISSSSSSSSSSHTNTYLFLLMLLVWWFYITITLSSSPVSCIPTGTKQGVVCQEIERQALLTLKAGLRDEGGRLSSWSGDDNPNCCNWAGVSCSNHTGHVLKLNLKNPFPNLYYPEEKHLEWHRFTLRGEISSSLLELKYLEYLDLSLNDFNSNKIPSFLGSLEKLRYLNLSSSSFSGVVPPHLGNLSSLQYLDLGGTYNVFLEVESLHWLTGMSSLKHLNLDGVNLEKAGGPDWLEAFNMLPMLLELHLSNCGLSNLPPLMYQSINFTSLTTLDLSFNNFNSTLTMPPWLFNLTGLVNVQLSVCSLHGVGFLDGFGKLVKLQQLDLSDNYLGGQLPASLGNLSNLVTLKLRSNPFYNGRFNNNGGLEGRIPVMFGNLCKLRELGLGKNKLEGEINEFIDGLARSCSHDGNNQLVSLDLYDNSLWGTIPTTIGSLTALKTLNLDYNQMNGTIAETIGKLSYLEELHLYGNPWQGLLTGSHFEMHTKLQQLEITTTSTKGNLVMNVTQDWIPPFRGSLTDLALDGVKMWCRKFPRWTQTLRELDTLSLVDCGLTDSIPTEFWKSCPNITDLDLSDNAISVGMSFKNLERLLPLVLAGKLGLLTLANNSFSNGGGEIPSNIGQFAPSLEYLDLSSNSISGEIPHSICKLKYFHTLILRNNSLTGELTHHHWEEMRTLYMLDVSNNRLVGEIPQSLASLTSLTLLSLSDNNLQGEIPIFRNSTRLRLLDFGRNKLTGNIPPSLAENNPILLVLRLRGNMLSGRIPIEFCLLSDLQTLDLAHNSLQGTIPWCLGNLSTSDYDDYDFYTDGITLVSKGREDKYSDSILKLVHLVDLSDNNLSGSIPESLMNLIAMQTLNLSMNDLTGEIPSNIGGLEKLESLDLSQNQLFGPIPQSLSALSFLSALNLSQNNLSGKIPMAGTQIQTLNDSSRYEGNPLLCGPPLLTICPGNEPTKENEGEDEKHGKAGFDLDEWGFIMSLVLGFVVGFWGVCGSLVLKASWRKAYFGYLVGIKDKIIVTVVVNVARLRRKMEDVRVAR